MLSYEELWGIVGHCIERKKMKVLLAYIMSASVGLP